ncbi:MAG: Carbamoyltransferase HypF [Syntrophus sp. SKADARSKE-3]|nr:Carbamoyltransferase HypF [Syntrophus sp. SKADARSKE-3]
MVLDEPKKIEFMKRRRLLFTGIVQGVGFRPFIYRLAVRHGLTGFVQNRPDGVIAEVEGTEEVINAFIEAVPAGLPPMADLSSLSGSDVPLCGDNEFRIIASGKEGFPEVHIAPDIATCPECLAELFQKQDRRYRYPFINCTNCGPRLTIIHDIPYDRVNTSMSCFPMCPACLAEYSDPGNRRFHAEPNACPVCGPKLTLLNGRGEVVTAHDPLEQANKILRHGFILAVKGLGGFHLAVDAANDEAVQRLRRKKYREEKPLALMVRDLPAALSLADLNETEQELLLSPRRPIVLARKKTGKTILSPSIAPGMPDVGVMLPYTPLHHLLLKDHFPALVMTSGNQTDEPICIGNREAIERLHGIADFFLVNNRDILVRCDDSIATVVRGKTSIMRRSRGYVPKPLLLENHYPPVLALGPQMKSTLCILKGNLAFLSPHIGDLETPQARDFFHETLAVMKRITECHPQILACDLHPGYYATQAAQQMEEAANGEIILLPVQHHHAHIVSCMAENRLTGDVIGLAMDGTGYGTDGHIWGGEFLVANETTFTRIGHLKEFSLPGGEKAIRDPWRIAVSLLREAYGPSWIGIAEKLQLIPDGTHAEIIERMIVHGVNTPPTSSLGRIFDGVSVILGRRRHVTFEGQAAMELEGAARKGSEELLPYNILEENVLQLDLGPVIRTLAEKKIHGSLSEPLIFSFHETLAKAFAEMAVTIRKRTGLNRVVLSGGCFQNKILLEGTIQELEIAGFDVFSHSIVPTNDGGIALGQAICAASLRERKL